MAVSEEPPALFALPLTRDVRDPLGPFRRRLTHHRPAEPADPETPQAWAAAHVGARGRAPSGTIHLVTGDWLPVCGAGLNGWDPRGLQATTDPVTCARCGGIEQRRHPETQLVLF
ncbi:hypothetical protein ACFORH_43385 [Amycolatopsis roodepoortensis]|uniref:Uncharacterized protein n=1 Tax=Amycolatopsis roodepoortensis TaxID=700274 RepID=A0ABR9LIA0_9PSEU|nr:hypothetical protein [Amycolatopsis roodepoortensis]MBE1580414.1 hypothetical protein [Amycolatopsis roodepoortensis]